jgi:hypothetical protein
MASDEAKGRLLAGLALGLMTVVLAVTAPRESSSDDANTTTPDASTSRLDAGAPKADAGKVAALPDAGDDAGCRGMPQPWGCSFAYCDPEIELPVEVRIAWGGRSHAHDSVDLQVRETQTVDAALPDDGLRWPDPSTDVRSAADDIYFLELLGADLAQRSIHSQLVVDAPSALARSVRRLERLLAPDLASALADLRDGGTGDAGPRPDAGRSDAAKGD